MIASLDPEEVTKHCLGGLQGECNFLTESGLYEVLMLSRKPIAKQFKKEVKKILHEIRTNGGYIAGTENMSEEQILAKALQVAEKVIERNKLVIEQQKNQLILQAPKVEYCETVLDCHNLMPVNAVAVHLNISAMKLNDFLRKEGWIYKQGKTWYPSCKIREKGLCDFRTITFTNTHGENVSSHSLQWTESGRKAIIELFEKRMARGE
jgi:phage antirepressor YoqD-like protein